MGEFWDQKKWTIIVGNSAQGTSRQGALYLHIIISYYPIYKNKELWAILTAYFYIV